MQMYKILSKGIKAVTTKEAFQVEKRSSVGKVKARAGALPYKWTSIPFQSLPKEFKAKHQFWSDVATLIQKLRTCIS